MPERPADKSILIFLAIPLLVGAITRLLPDGVFMAIWVILVSLLGLACLCGYLYRRKMQREGKWPVPDMPET